MYRVLVVGMVVSLMVCAAYVPAASALPAALQATSTPPSVSYLVTLPSGNVYQVQRSVSYGQMVIVCVLLTTALTLLIWLLYRLVERWILH
jgi:ABC-type multidrug transport system permease subunit